MDDASAMSSAPDLPDTWHVVEVVGKTAPEPPSILRPGLPITPESLIHGRRPDAA